MKRLSLCVGAPKCGTTWLDSVLRRVCPTQLPQARKETFFFDHHFGAGEGWYRKQFCETESFVEIGPSYFCDPDAPARARQTTSNLRVLILLRDPYKRAASHLLHEMYRGQAWLTESQTVVSEAAKKRVLAYSRYENSVKEWMAISPEFVCVQKFPIEDERQFADALTDFLGGETSSETLRHAISDAKNERVYEAQLPRNRNVARIREVLRRTGMRLRFPGSRLKKRKKRDGNKSDDSHIKAARIAAEAYVLSHLDLASETRFYESIQ